MSYCIEKNESVGSAVRRISCEQTEKALFELAQKDEPVEWRIHQLRKRCKKIRALVRLVRPGFDAYSEVNRRFRDIARTVSAERDARVMADLVSALAGADDDLRSDDEPLARWFSLNCSLAEELAGPVLELSEAAMARAAVEVEKWDVSDLTIEDAVDGLAKTLERAHEEYDNVRSNGSVSDFHSFRKRCKYHWYHLRLLRKVMEGGGDERRKIFDDLCDLIGDPHDRSVLLEHLRELPPFLKRDKGVYRIEAEALRRRRKLRRKALAKCEGVFNMPPEKFADFVGRYWESSAH